MFVFVLLLYINIEVGQGLALKINAGVMQIIPTFNMLISMDKTLVPNSAIRGTIDSSGLFWPF